MSEENKEESEAGEAKRLRSKLDDLWSRADPTNDSNRLATGGKLAIVVHSAYLFELIEYAKNT